MPLKFNQLSFSSSAADQPNPPYGAPTGHFGDQSDNIQREALSAINELGQAVIGNDLGGGAHSPGNLPAIQSGGDMTAALVNQLGKHFAQMIFDMSHPVGQDIRILPSTQGLTQAQVSATLVPDGLAGTYSPCDGQQYNGITTPNFVDQVLVGGDPLNASEASRLFTGDTLAAEQTSSDTTGISETDGHALTEAQLGPHKHSDGTLKTSSDSAGTPRLDSRASPASSSTGGNQALRGGSGGVIGRTNDSFDALSGHDHDVSGSTGSSGDGTEHSHGITDPGHDHTTGKPPRAVVELWMRTA